MNFLLILMTKIWFIGFSLKLICSVCCIFDFQGSIDFTCRKIVQDQESITVCPPKALFSRGLRSQLKLEDIYKNPEHDFRFYNPFRDITHTCCESLGESEKSHPNLDFMPPGFQRVILNRGPANDRFHPWRNSENHRRRWLWWCKISGR